MEDVDGAAAPPPGMARELARWSETLAAIARTGLGFTQNLYEQERFEEVLHVAADIKVAARELAGGPADAETVVDVNEDRDDDDAETAREQDHFVQEWLESVGVGVPGYVTPKVAIGAVVGNDAGELLLVQRADSGIWLYPTGWADVGYSPAEVAVKEVAEETGVVCEPQRVVAVIDGQRMGFSRFGMYMLLFHCRAVGGELAPHPLECADVGWFAEDALPPTTAGAQWWSHMAFAAIRGEAFPTIFDAVRSPVWRA
ncbi:MAG: NUDIX hydrolase N-terminal domain-containing protein [Ilumatobacteraceae bacterium]